MPLLLAQQDAVLKDLYEGAIREQLNQDVVLFNILHTSDKGWSGRRVVFPAHTGRNAGGVGARAENTTLPVAGNQTHETVIVSSTYQYGRFRVSGPTIASGKNAFADALAMEMDGLEKDFAVELGRQTWGTGDGRLAQIATSATAGSGSLVVPVFNRFSRAGQPGGRFCTVGRVVAVGSIANAIADNSQTISAVSISTNPAVTTDDVTLGNSGITFSSSQQFLYNQGAGGSGGVGRELLGLQAIVDVFTTANMWGSNAFWSANLLGIARSTSPRWNATVLENSGTGRVLDSYLMQQAFDTIHEEIGAEANIILGHHSVVRALFDTLVADRRYTTTTFDGGYAKMTYAGVEVRKDRHAPYNSLFVGVREALELFTLKDIGFADRDGAILSRVTDVDMWEGFLCYYGNIGVTGAMKSLVMIRDIRTDL